MESNHRTGYELEPITPREAVDLYLDTRKTELAASSLTAHRSRLGHFIRWCDEQDITNLNDLTPRDFTKFSIWRRDDGDLNNVTLNTQLHTLRVFIRKCEAFQAVLPRLHVYVEPTRLAPREGVRHAFIEPEIAKRIIKHYRKYEYASLDHVVLEILWATGVRTGTLRSFDLDDWNSGERRLNAQHRPETETPLKNGEDGQRPIVVSKPAAEVIDDYIKTNRNDITDKHGRKPLITTRFGRPARQTIRNIIYRATLPCVYSGECPHNRNPTTCEWNQNRHSASTCPSSRSPHGMRKAAITEARKRDIPIEAVSLQMNVSPEIIRKVYDKRTIEEKTTEYAHYWDLEPAADRAQSKQQTGGYYD
ncbi:tyrosine-type recombinase/integrase [Haloarchaeobius amylolyticus]|uniref:tyrosine-type recombinase/integrase n=1 Tax=Haloarchaeobius amylolyticus TaxID=1198296 RepID=UPI002271B2DD|nr:site-specific integrase [Haloarchaeobius amylolyticus]